MSFLADRSAVSIGLGGIPSLRSGTGGLNPSLDLNFAVSKSLDPRITFTRASEARYYDASTVAVAEQNLLTYSQAFDNAAWVKTTTTIAADSFAAPDGTTTAETLTAGGTNSTVLQTFTALALPYTFSVWLYRKTGTGNVDISVDGATWVTQTLTAGWTRFNTTLTPSAGAKTAGVRLVTSGDEVYVWGAQLEQRSTVTAYTPTTTAAITNYIPVLQTAANGVARFDHNPVTRESLGLLIEEQRTNLLTYSEQFDNAAWTKNDATVSANAIVSPDGTLTGDKVIATTTANQHFISFADIPANTYTWSVYMKAAELTRGVISCYDGAYKVGTIFNLSAGTVVSQLAGSTSTIVSVGNGWYRCSVTATLTATSVFGGFQIRPNLGGSFGESAAGNGFSGIYIWGAQLEAGAFATSYIPTVASQVTRSADAASMTGTNFSSWYRQDEGTVLAESSPHTGAALFVDAHNPATVDIVRSWHTSTSSFPRTIVAGVNTSAFSMTGLTAPIRSALAYKINDFAASANGGAVQTDASGNVPTGVNRLTIGQNDYSPIGHGGHIKRIAYYPVRLANTTLQSLTA